MNFLPIISVFFMEFIKGTEYLICSFFFFSPVTDIY